MSKVFTITEGLENMGAIRSGGQGSVYKGRRIGEIITAIKLLSTPIVSQSEDNKHYRDFQNEVRKLQKVNEEPNPNVVKILSSGISETGGFPFIEMEFIDGPDLGELLKPPHDSIFTVKEAIKVAEQLANALAQCHRLDVKHGDIKSNNIRLNNHTGNYVLLDFGLAILSNEQRRSSLRNVGAVEFMAPEQYEGKMFFETDIYSFGIVIYELLAGRVPFPLGGNGEAARNKVMAAHMETPPPDLLSLRAASMPLHWPDEKKAVEMHIPEWLFSLLEKCLQKKPEDRFANGVALHDFIDQQMISAAGETATSEKAQSLEVVLEEKERSLDHLQSIVEKQEKEIESWRQKKLLTIRVDPEHRKVSKSLFFAVLAALCLTSGLLVYIFFFHAGDTDPNDAGPSAFTTNDSVSAKTDPHTVIVSETKSTAKGLTKQQRKKQLRDSLAALPKEQTTQAVPPEERADSAAKPVSQPAEIERQETRETPKDSSDKNNPDKREAMSKRYKVRNIAYFHNSPDESTRRKAFINHWNNAILKPLDEKNGFIYIVYTNDEGQTSKGWLSKIDLVAIK